MVLRPEMARQLADGSPHDMSSMPDGLFYLVFFILKKGKQNKSLLGWPSFELNLPAGRSDAAKALYQALIHRPSVCATESAIVTSELPQLDRPVIGLHGEVAQRSLSTWAFQARPDLSLMTAKRIAVEYLQQDV